jgi:hypothetical protein
MARLHHAANAHVLATPPRDARHPPPHAPSAPETTYAKTTDAQTPLALRKATLSRSPTAIHAPPTTLNALTAKAPTLHPPENAHPGDPTSPPPPLPNLRQTKTPRLPNPLPTKTPMPHPKPNQSPQAPKKALWMRISEWKIKCQQGPHPSPPHPPLGNSKIRHIHRRSFRQFPYYHSTKLRKKQFRVPLSFLVFLKTPTPTYSSSTRTLYNP